MSEPGPPPSATVPQRTHPVTPLVHAGRAMPVALLAGLGILGGPLSTLGVLGGLVSLILAAGALCLLVGGFAYVSWSRFTYWFDAQGDLRVDSGVVTRRERRLQLSRLQGVDVVQPLLARLFGMAGVSVEVAGAGDSKAVVQYLTLSEAQGLRNSVVARAAGLRPDAGEAPQRAIVTVPARDLAVSLLLRGSTVALLGLTTLVVVGVVATEGPVGLLGLVAGGLPLLIVAAEFANYYGFTVADSPDGLRTRSGLLQVAAQTIPPGRVQALEFVQSWLWRRKDWVRVRITVAGQGGGEEDEQEGKGFERVLLPVAPYEVALGVVNEILPGVDARRIDMEPTGSSARKRAWIQHRQLGVGFDERVFVTQRGRFVRRLALAPHARTQSVRVTQGPWERLLGLATMHLDSPPGPVRVVALYREAGEARRLADEQNERAKQALAADADVRWMRHRQEDQ